MADGVAVYDAQGRPVQMNRAYRGLLALERAPAGFTGMSALDQVRLLDMHDAACGGVAAPGAHPHRPYARGEVVTGPGASHPAFLEIAEAVTLGAQTTSSPASARWGTESHDAPVACAGN